MHENMICRFERRSQSFPNIVPGQQLPEIGLAYAALPSCGGRGVRDTHTALMQGQGSDAPHSLHAGAGGSLAHTAIM